MFLGLVGCMFDSVSYYLILGVPFVVYLGIIAVVLFIGTALFLVIPKKKSPVMFQWHRWVAFIALAVGIIHAFLGVMLYI